MGSIGVNEWYRKETGERKRYFTSSFTADYAYHYSVRSAVTLGADVMYDGSQEQAIKYTSPEDVTSLSSISLPLL